MPKFVTKTRVMFFASITSCCNIATVVQIFVCPCAGTLRLLDARQLSCESYCPLESRLPAKSFGITMSQEANLSEPIDASLLRAEEWSYLAEGGQNLLVRYTGPTAAAGSSKASSSLEKTFTDRLGGPAALRIRKRKKKSTAEVQEQEEDVSELLDSQTFQAEIIGPLLQDGTLIPPGCDARLLTLASGARVLSFSVPVKLRSDDGRHDASFLQELSQRIAPSTPNKRRAVDDIDTEQPVIWAVEDLTAADATSDTAQVLSIEIKVRACLEAQIWDPFLTVFPCHIYSQNGCSSMIIAHSVVWAKRIAGNRSTRAISSIGSTETRTCYKCKGLKSCTIHSTSYQKIVVGSRRLSVRCG